MNTDQKIGHAYTVGDFSVFSDLQLLDAICRVETLGKAMPAAMLPLFRAEAEKRGLVGALDLAPVRTVTRKEYNGARRLLRDNGRYSLRWMNTRVAAVMRQLQEAKPDDLAEKQAFFTGPHAAKVPAGYWTAAQRVKGWAGV